MSTFDLQMVVARLAPLVPVLHRVGGEAVTSADEAMSSIDIPRYPVYHSTRVHVARARIHRSLEQEDLGE